MTVSVLGLGNFGTALANHLAAKGMPVIAWGRDAQVVESINNQRRNPKYLSHVDLNPNIRATSDLTLASQSDLVVVVVPSAGLSQLFPQLQLKASSVLVSGIKGIDFNSGLTPLGCAEKFLPLKPRLAVISGPGFAKDIVAQRPAGLVAASIDEAAAQLVAELFSSSWMKVYTSDDPVGVELGGIVKNVIAIAAGVCDGLRLGDSARAGLITRGLAEMMRLAGAMQANRQTLFGLAGLGDLVLTATCDASRNRTVGLRLGQGESLDQIIDTLGSVAEGVKTTPAVLALADKYGIEMPITHQVNRLLMGAATPEQMLQALISRPVKKEFETA